MFLQISSLRLPQRLLGCKNQPSAGLFSKHNGIDVSESLLSNQPPLFMNTSNIKFNHTTTFDIRVATYCSVRVGELSDWQESQQFFGTSHARADDENGIDGLDLRKKIDFQGHAALFLTRITVPSLMLTSPRKWNSDLYIQLCPQAQGWPNFVPFRSAYQFSMCELAGNSIQQNTPESYPQPAFYK